MAVSSPCYVIKRGGTYPVSLCGVNGNRAVGTSKKGFRAIGMMCDDHTPGR